MNMAIQVNELTDYMEDYLEEIKVNDLTTQTIKNYQFAINAFIKYIQNEKPDLQEIDKTNIKQLIRVQKQNDSGSRRQCVDPFGVPQKNPRQTP